MDVVRRLSGGGMAEVFLAKKRGAHGFEKLVAVKVIRDDLLSHTNMRAMFLDEAKILSRLDHPTIAQIYDFGEEPDGTLYIGMEYVPGMNLARILARRKVPFPPGIAAQIVLEVCRGLHVAHELTDGEGRPLGVVHRDMSPQNVMLTFEGRVKILDFGVARMDRHREAATTLAGVIKGKLAYMAPEQLLGERVDRRADIYSLNVVLHELLTGHRLFSKNDAVTDLAKQRLEVAAPSTRAPEVPKSLDEIVLRGLQPRIDDRYEDARAMALALEAFIQEASGETVEAFVERELSTEREIHRNWIRSLESAEPAQLQKEERPTALAGAFEGRTEPSSLSVDIDVSVPSAYIAEERIAAFGRPWVRWAQRLATFGIIALAVFIWMYPDMSRQYGKKLWVVAVEQKDRYWPSGEGADKKVLQPSPEVKKANRRWSKKKLAKKPEPVEEPAPVAPEPMPAPTPKPTPQLASRSMATAPTAKKRHPRSRSRLGLLSVIARPGGTIYVGGKKIGKTPLKGARLAPGRHMVALKRDGDEEPRWKSWVTVRPGQHARIRLR